MATNSLESFLYSLCPGASRLPTLRLRHSSQCLEAFHCSSAVNCWWSIVTWANGRHSLCPRVTVYFKNALFSIQMCINQFFMKIKKT